MTAGRQPTIDELAVAVTGRRESLFAADVARHQATIGGAVAGRTVLAIGGAGSIGSACVRELLAWQPASLTVVDQDENALVELVRDLRSGDRLGPTTLRTAPLDFGAPVMRQFLREARPPHLVLHFAANKHVRAERDRCSLLQMLDTNLLKVRRLCRWLRDAGFDGRLFAVSTDKAANPTNFLGASKRLMEQLVMAPDALPAAAVTSARFANVAFSNGSLLWGFLRRLERDQPLAVPAATRRYFLSPIEAAHLCLLAATVAPAGHVVVPHDTAAIPLQDLTAVAATVVRCFGREPHFCDDEHAGKRALAGDLAAGRHPIVRTRLDTGGEKPFEEFVADGETTVDIGCARARAVPGARRSTDRLHALLDALDADLQRDEGRLGIAELSARVADLLPRFAHAASDRHLDQRM